MKIKIHLSLIAAFLILISCDKDEKEAIVWSTVSQEELKINGWIKETMETYYLWSDEIPTGLETNSTSDSKSFFERFVYTPEDHWSWISDDYYETSDLYSGITTTAGHEFSLALTRDNSVIGIIEYVLSGSPAEKLGIKRGDIFTKIDNTTLNIDNYYALITKGGTYTIDLAEIVNKQIKPTRQVSITEVEKFQEDPILIDTVYAIADKKIGYFHYTSFIYRQGEEGQASQDSLQLIDCFRNFESQGVTDLVVDLRYNGGGSVPAEELIANLIAPKSAVGELFSKSHYNTYMTSALLRQLGAEFFNSKILETPGNINLNGQLIGLISSSTASASEGLLNGLDPFVDLTLIGDTTHGKYTSMWVLPDDDNDPQWAIIPIVAKNTNKDDVSVRGGMIPNTYLDDDPLDGYQLGDIRETMLAKAIEKIIGTPSTKSSSVQNQFLVKNLGSFKDGQKVKAEPHIIGWGNKILIKE